MAATASVIPKVTPSNAKLLFFFVLLFVYKSPN